MPKPPKPLDVVIVGAGPAGIGMACVLQAIGITRYAILERHEVGASFRRWPAEMRLITPSFTGNAFGLIDLNAITLDTSPAYTLDTEHPSGPQYADYLQAIVDEFQLPVQTEVEVRGITPRADGTEGFEVLTSRGRLPTRFVIWAAGEFQYPRLDPFPGAEHCRHTSQVKSWKRLTGDDFVIIGGYESGIDAAYGLCTQGKRVTVLDRGDRWGGTGSDPSQTLSPYTFQRLRAIRRGDRLTLVEKVTVKSVVKEGAQYVVHGRRGRQGAQWITTQPPLLATGFQGSLSLVEDLFDWDDDGVLLSERDESTRTPGLFLSGPLVRHGKVLLCFIYKFRQRFAVIASAIGAALDRDLAPLERYRAKQMFLEDLSCCLDECAC